MPIPFFVGAGAAVVAGAYGVKKGLDAKEDMDRAESINDKAQKIADEAKSNIESARTSTDRKLVNLGKVKISIMSGTVKDFVETFSKIKNINIKNSPGLDELKPDSQEFIEIKNASFGASELQKGGVGGIAAGTLAAAGAYGAVSTFAAAGTGTAIAGLSGAAATNATLAWLGGGTLAAGGMGVAGGMMVLGGLVAGPALALGGAFMASKAKEALYDARSNRDKAEVFAEQAKGIVSNLNFIKERANQLEDLLKNLDKYFAPAISNMKGIVEKKGTDFQYYSKKEQNLIMVTGQLAKTIKTVIDTSLINEEGELDTRFNDILTTVSSRSDKLKTVLADEHGMFIEN